MADPEIAVALVKAALSRQGNATPLRYRVTDQQGSFLVTIEREAPYQTKATVLAERKMQSISPTGSGDSCQCCGGTGRQ
jgi:hypothetical protein